MKQKRLFVIMLILTLIGLTSGVMVPDVSAAPDKVKVAYVAIINFAPLYVAIDRGFMNEQTSRLTCKRLPQVLMPWPSWPREHWTPGASVSAHPRSMPSIKGFDLRIVGSAAIQPAKGGPTIIIVRKDLKDSGKVKSIADLKGRKVAIAGGPATTGAYFVAKALKEAGLTVKDIEIVNLANPDMPLAMEKAAVDAALVGPPYSDQIIAGGKGVLLHRIWRPTP